MVDEKENKRISKFLSLVLRHQPGKIGLTLDENGWAGVAELITKMNHHGVLLSRELLDHIVATNNKKRFSYDETGTRIRASQGHSIEVELDLKPMQPPPYLYHGTGEKSVASILKSGIEKRNRQYVHLSSDVETATKVGSRHGRPKVIVVSAKQMSLDGFIFYLSENKVWLTEHVPPAYLTIDDD